MRTAVSLVFLLLMAPLLGGLSAAEISTDETSITVTGTETWDASNPIDLDLTITDGASLFIDDSTTVVQGVTITCLLYTSPSPRDAHESRMPSSA